MSSDANKPMGLLHVLIIAAVVSSEACIRGSGPGGTLLRGIDVPVGPLKRWKHDSLSCREAIAAVARRFPRALGAPGRCPPFNSFSTSTGVVLVGAAPKAGSTSLRNGGWVQATSKDYCNRMNRSKGEENHWVDDCDFANATRAVLVVREPLSRFLAGVRQVWKLPKYSDWLPADIVPATAVFAEKAKDHWDEHTTPLVAFLPPPLTSRIVRLEHAAEEWPIALRTVGIDPAGAAYPKLLGPGGTHENDLERIDAMTPNESAVFWTHFCELYAVDYACFDYPRPRQCASVQGNSGNSASTSLLSGDRVTPRRFKRRKSPAAGAITVG